MKYQIENGGTVSFKAGDYVAELVLLREVTTPLPDDHDTSDLPADFRRLASAKVLQYKEMVNMANVTVSPLASKEVVVEEGAMDVAAAAPVVLARSTFLGNVVCRQEPSGRLVYYISAKN